MTLRDEIIIFEERNGKDNLKDVVAFDVCVCGKHIYLRRYSKNWYHLCSANADCKAGMQLPDNNWKYMEYTARPTNTFLPIEEDMAGYDIIEKAICKSCGNEIYLREQNVGKTVQWFHTLTASSLCVPFRQNADGSWCSAQPILTERDKNLVADLAQKMVPESALPRYKPKPDAIVRILDRAYCDVCGNSKPECTCKVERLQAMKLKALQAKLDELTKQIAKEQGLLPKESQKLVTRKFNWEKER